MAINMRRGKQEEFDPQKMLPGEWAVTLDKKNIFMCFSAGDVRRMATYEEMVENINNATKDVQAMFTADVQAAIREATTATTNANTAITNANTATTNANASTAKMEALYEKVKATDLGGLVIGGRNMIPKSNVFSSGWLIYSGAVATFEENVTVAEWGAKDATRVVITGGTNTVKMLKTIAQPSAAGQCYAASVWIKNEGTTNIRVGNNLAGSAAITILPGESRRATPCGTGDGTRYFQLNLSTENVSHGISAVLWRAQGEHGTIASDWTPAPEDTDAAIAAKKDDLYGMFMDDRAQTTGYWHKMFTCKISAYSYTDISVVFLVKQVYNDPALEKRINGILVASIRQNANGVIADNSENSLRWISATHDIRTSLADFAINVVANSAGNYIELYIHNRARNAGYKASVIDMSPRYSGHALTFVGEKIANATTTLTALPTNGTIIYSTLGDYMKEATVSTAGLMSAADKARFDNTGVYFAICATAAGTAAKTVEYTGFNLVVGARVTVKFTNAITVANATLNVNSTGAKTIVDGGVALEANRVGAGTTLELIYDGTSWVVANDTDSGWLTLTPASGFVVYGGNEVYAVKCRRVGKAVMVMGELSPKSVLTGGTATVDMFTLPAGFRPTIRISDIKQGSGRKVWLFQITTGGIGQFSRLRDETGNSDASTTEWLPFSQTFMV